MPDHWLRLGCGIGGVVVSVEQQVFEPALVAAIELMDDLLSPEVYGHAMPTDAHARAFVVRAMLRREYSRRIRDAREKTNL